MRTRKYFRYLVAMIIALSTTVNAMAQQRNLKIYFNQYVKGATAPTIKITDDNNAYDIPAGVTVSSEGVAWAGKSRFFEWITTDVTDRVMADYVSASDKKHSHLKLNFTNFPYEVNVIQWNVMNDLLSGSIGDFFKNYNVTTKCTPVSGSGFSYTEEHWSMNIFTHSTTFNQGDIPWQSGATLNGLKSFEISEKYERKIGIGSWTWFDLGESELSDKNRTFIKAGWDGKTSNSNITDSDDSNWAFKVKFTLPDIRMRCYATATNKVDNNVTVGENAGTHKIQGYISAHAGAVVPIEAPTDPDDIDPDAFHYEYEADKTKINIHPYTGVIYEAKVAGDITVTVKLMRGNRFVCSYPQTIHVLEKEENNTPRPEIAIGFLNVNKGYDITVGDQNAQIKGYIMANGENITLSNNGSGYHFEFSEDSNNEIIEIDRLTGKITAKKEGNVNVSAVLKNGTTIVSKTCTYALHVFAKHEGLNWHRVTTYYSNNNINDNLKITNSTRHTDNYNTEYNYAYDWKKIGLKTNISMWENSLQKTSDWKQITGFKTVVDARWRVICQKVGLDVKVPKYSDVQFTYTLAGNVNCQEGINYGFEVKDLGVVTSGDADVIIKSFTWNANGTVAPSGTVPQTIIYAGAGSTSTNQVAAKKDVSLEKSNKNSADPITETRYLAIMSYLGINNDNKGDAAFGYKGIPTYTYYTTITYYNNDGTEDVWYKTDTPLTTTDKTKSFKMPNTIKNLPERAGYEFLGWSTDPNATTAEYPGKDGDFYPYDDVNGGGKGPVSLYAVWKGKDYIVTLHKNNGGNDETVLVTATYNQPMPEDIGLVAPTTKGYDFNGYRTYKDIRPRVFYYNADMTSAHIYDHAENYDLYADWKTHKTTVVFDPQGGNNDGVTRVTATYDAAMPTEGVQAPQREGYTFGGYYSEANGQGTQYYTANMTSARTWNIDERLLNPQVTEVTLYAKWIPLTYTVTLDRQGGTGGTTSVTAAYGQPMPTITVPTRPGYEFYGYFAEQPGYNDNWLNGGTRYYNSDGTSAKNWDKNDNVTLYAHWKSAKYIVTFDINGGIMQEHTQYKSDASMSKLEEITDQLIKISFTYGHGGSNDITNAKPKKGGFKCIGFYDDDNVLVASVNTDPANYNITINKNNKYWKDGNWNWPHDVTFTARYEPKFTYENNVLDFGTETLEIGRDWSQGVIHDVVDAAEYLMTEGRVSANNPVMVVNLNNAHYLRGDLDGEFLKVPLENKPYFSPNLLVYFKGYYNLQENQVQDDKCLDLVVTDRFPIKIPYAFNASKASYARDAQVNDAATEQASKSTWGTLCLPYPIKNNNTYKDVSKVIFYELRKHSGNVMQFYKLPEDAVIPANTPVLYERTVGISSAVTIEENAKDINNMSTWIPVPDNPNFTAVVKSYADAPEPSIRDWEFRGNLKTNIFYGAKYVGDIEENAQRVDNGDVYYFKQNKFTHLTPAMVKNGVRYEAGKMTIYPYRAYFYKKGTGGSAKIASYSILVVDEFGNTTDITNIVFGDGEGDGKIYDLNGIRVMQPVKGRLYIVNGQKKVYR